MGNGRRNSTVLHKTDYSTSSLLRWATFTLLSRVVFLSVVWSRIAIGLVLLSKPGNPALLTKHTQDKSTVLSRVSLNKEVPANTVEIEIFHPEWKSVIIYWSSCWSKLVWHSLICGTQKRILWRMFTLLFSMQQKQRVKKSPSFKCALVWMRFNLCGFKITLGE